MGSEGNDKKYFRIFAVISILTLLYGIQVLHESQTNQQHNSLQAKDNNLPDTAQSAMNWADTAP